MAYDIPEGFELVDDSIPEGFEEVKDEPGVVEQLLRNTGGMGMAIGDIASGIVTGIPAWVKAQYDVAMGGDPAKERAEMHETMSRLTPSQAFPEIRENQTYKYMMKPFELLSEGLEKGVGALGGGEKEKLLAEGAAMVLPIPGAKMAGKAGRAIIERVDPGVRNAMPEPSRAFEKDVKRGKKSSDIPEGFEEVGPNPAEVGTQGEILQPINPYDVGGHVEALRRGEPTVVDSPQMELFGRTERAADVPEQLKHAEEAAKTNEILGKAEQAELFDPYTNMHREFDQFGNEELPRALTREEFEQTIANLEKEQGTVYRRPEDIDAAYEQYLSTMDGMQPGLFDRPSQQEAFSRIAQEEARVRMEQAIEARIDDHPIVRGARTHLKNMEERLAQMEAEGKPAGEIQAQQRKVAAAEKRLETARKNVGEQVRSRPGERLTKQVDDITQRLNRVARSQRGSVDPAVFGEALSKGLDKLAEVGKPVFGAIASSGKEDPIKRVPGLEDYKPVNTPQAAKEATLTSPDIKPMTAQSVSSGARNLGIRTGHPLVRFFSTMISDYVDGPAKHMIDQYLNSKDGVATLKNRLKKNEFESAMRTLLEGDQAGKRFTPEELYSRGLNDRQVAFIESVYRNNENIYKLGGRGEHLEGYFPHNFSGDYIALVYNKEKRPVFVLNAKDAREMKQAMAWAEKTFDRSEHTITEPARRDMNDRPMWDKGIIGLRDLEALLSTGPIDNQALAGMIQGRDMAQTRNIYNFGVHDKTRAREQVGGYDGNKPWKTEAENLREAYESYVRYSEQGYYHHLMQEPLNAVKQLLNDPEVKAAAPNAVNAVENYMRNITGQPTYFTGKALDTLVDGMAKQLGFGRNAPRKLVQELKGFTQMFQLGLDITNFAIQMLQPIINGIPQATVAAKLSKLNLLEVQQAALGTWLDAMKYMVSKDKPDGFIKEAMQFADEHGLMSFSETEAALDSTKGRVRRGIERFGNSLPRIAETATRPPFFITMAGILREAWSKDPTLFKDKQEMFQTAKNMTQSAMIDYSEFQRPYVYRKFGGQVGGSLLSQFKTYMHGQLGYLRTLAAKDKAAFAAAVGMMVYLVGLEGLPGVPDLDNLVKLATSKFGDQGPMQIRDIALKDFPEWVKTGGLSSMTGINFQGRFAFNPLVDENVLSMPWKVSPATSTVGDIAKAALDAASKRDELSAKNLAYQATPRQFRGFEEDAWFRKGDDFINPRTGLKEIKRTEFDWNVRKAGLTSLRENREREDTFAATERLRHFQQKQDETLDIPIREFMINGRISKETLDAAFADYMKYKGDPATFVTRLEARAKEAMQTRKQRGQGVPSGSYSSIQRYQIFNEPR